MTKYSAAYFIDFWFNQIEYNLAGPRGQRSFVRIMELNMT